MKRGYLIAVLLLFSISIIELVSGAQVVTIVSPTSWSNWTGTIDISVTTGDALNVTGNVSIFCNKSGGSVSARGGADVINLVNMTNSTNTLKLFNATNVNISSLTDSRLYNCSAYADNQSAQTWATRVYNVTIDNTPPNVSSTLVSTINYGNYTGTIVLNVTVNDPTIGLNYVYFNITYSNGTQVNYSQAAASGGYYSTSIDTTTFLEGSYNLTVFANDTLNNINTSTKLFLTFDGIAPTGGMSCSPSSVYRGEAVTCTCSGSDGGGTGVASTAGSTSLSTPETGEFTKYCIITDYAGNSVTVAGMYTVKLRPSSTRSVPLNAATTQTGNKTNESITASETNPLTAGEQQKGMLLGVSYWVWITFTLIALAVLLGWKFLPRVKKKRK